MRAESLVLELGLTDSVIVMTLKVSWWRTVTCNVEKTTGAPSSLLKAIVHWNYFDMFLAMFSNSALDHWALPPEALESTLGLGFCLFLECLGA